jgi:transposase
VIASLIRLGHTLSLIIPEGRVAELRELIHDRDRRMKERTAFTNILESLMFKVFPEFVRTVKKLSSKTALYLMENYPTPDRLKELTLDELNQILRKVSRGRWREAQAKRLLRAANNSLGTREGVLSISMEIAYILSQIKATDSFIDRLEKGVKEHLEKIPYAKRLLEMKGIGHITVGGIIGEVADFTRFRRQSEIIKLAGLDLYERSSGKHKGRHRISKRGRFLLRKLLYFGALNTVRKGGIFHDYYQRLLKKGKEKPKALIAVARKLLKLMFAIVRDGNCYIENHKSNSVYLERVA